LTINPDTGLPEAGMLSDLFKSIAPIALGAFLGPAGAAIGGGFLTAAQAGLAVGGITSLATGSLSRGLMAGLGAYGGAGLGDSFMNAGSASLASSAGATAGAEATQQGLSEALRARAIDDAAISQGFNEAVGKTAASDVLGAGAKSAMTNPMAFAKNNLTNIGMAAAPLMAMQPTTKMPDPKDTGYIRQYDFNINPDTGKPDPLYGLRAMTPVKASEFGNKTFQGQRELFRQQNPNPYEIGVASLNQPPKPMATGGIVALADGGVTDAQVVDWFKANPGAKDTDIAAAMQQFNVNPEQVARATGTQDKQAEYENRYLTATNQNVLAAADKFGDLSTATTGGTGTAAIADYMDKSGINAQEYATALASRFGPASAGSATNPYTAEGIQALYDTASKVGNQADIINAASPIKDIHDTRNDKTWVDYMDKNKLSVSDAARAFGLSDKEVQQRYDAVKKPPVKPITFTNPVTGGTMTAPTRTTTTVLPTDPTVNAPPGTKNPYGGPNTPGDKTYNPDGSITVTPNIPGRPYGGFSGMDEVKDAYTAGGGSLGYTPTAPKTIEEFNQLYNKQTGDSLAAYDYLMGKGGGKYPVKSGVSKIAVPYDEFVLGRKPTNLKPKTTTTTIKGTPGQPQTYFDEAAYLAANPDVAAELKSGKSNFTTAYEHYLRYGKTEGRKFAGDYEGYTTAAALAAAANDAPGTTTAKDGGMMGYAVGGGLGSLGSYSDGGRLLKGPGDGVSDSIPATIGRKQQPARLADGEFVIPARIVSELGNGSTDAGAKKLYAMMDRVQRARGKTTGKNKVAANSRSDKYLPA
jgi:hypothetical protein